ncbi:hypothetical protein [Sphingomonas sanguinis]|jgi:predicted nucleic acid-binding Zn ribbon protein|uniref:Uncharacterized protein n=1 Tax=Sphingomonas sanguinis TaxID=33051 RepID=A0A7Y7QUV7_9SPHN|nr:hypothetical protein [Sphingomonas sanguinis]MBZ6381817.1 hypothetical protein [Sphingomonas sanguinis]NNG48421.1 hypothetical protein [Sphingomonas sanguinis]NNG54043.1 hypothetical protein [Sphingomonas sanguinis]NVP31117.1 hypothetical protein [Sphingomonas sanguinis]
MGETEGMIQDCSFRKRLRSFFLILIGIIAFVAVGIELQDGLGIPFDTTYRIACAGACLAFIAKLGWDSSGESWPWIGLGLATAVNVALFFTPVFDRPASRGEIMMFASPDTAILFAARIWDYPVTDDHQRAIRQQLVMGLIFAVIVSALLMASAFVPDRPDRHHHPANSLNAAATRHSG